MNSIQEHQIKDLIAATKDWDAQQSYDSLTTLRDKYESLVRTAKWESNQEIIDLAINTFPKMYWGSVKVNAYIPTEMWELVMDFFLQDESLQQLVKTEEGELALAGFCCDNAVSLFYETSSERRKKLSSLLEKWTNHQINTSQKSLLSQVVSILYGPACWNLYGQDTTTDTELIGIVDAVMAAKLPFHFKNQPKNNESKVLTTVDLPEFFKN